MHDHHHQPAAEPIRVPHAGERSAEDEFATYDWGGTGREANERTHPMNAWVHLRSWHLRPSRRSTLRWHVEEHWGTMVLDAGGIPTPDAGRAPGPGPWNSSGWTPGRTSRLAA